MAVIEELAIRCYEDGRASARTDPVILESRVEVDVNDGQQTLAMLCLPQDLDALAVGFLVGEGALHGRDDLAEVEVSVLKDHVRVRGDFDADALASLSARWTWGTGCGGGGTARDFQAPAYATVAGGATLAAPALLELTRAFQKTAELWPKTGGVHACALADAGGIRLFSEDVGRHNAFDKVIGRAFLDRLDLSDKLVLATGRLSAEIVSKAVAAGVGMLVSRSAVTALAVRLARRFGVTLVGFCRGRRLNVYTGFQRIVESGGPTGAGTAAESP